MAGYSPAGHWYGLASTATAASPQYGYNGLGYGYEYEYGNQTTNAVYGGYYPAGQNQQLQQQVQFYQQLQQEYYYQSLQGQIFYKQIIGTATANAVYYTTPQLSEEEIAEQQRQAQEAAAKHAVAASRAEELLFRFMTEEHKKSYIERGHFDVPVKGKIYRIHKGRSLNIIQMDKKGTPKLKLCAHPGEFVPDADTVLAQYLMLTTDEERFLAIANKHDLAA